MRHTPCGCCPPDRAAGAGRFCLFVQTRRGGRLCPPAALEARDASGGTIFSLAREKMVEKRVLGDANSAYARKNESSDFTYFRYTFRRPNALRATVKSGFRIAR